MGIEKWIGAGLGWAFGGPIGALLVSVLAVGWVAITKPSDYRVEAVLTPESAPQLFLILRPHF